MGFLLNFTRSEATARREDLSTLTQLPRSSATAGRHVIKSDFTVQALVNRFTVSYLFTPSVSLTLVNILTPDHGVAWKT